MFRIVVLTAIAVSWILPQAASAAGPNIALTLTPASIPAVGASQSVAQVLVTDLNSAPVPGDLVTFNQTGTTVTFSSPSCTTDTNGTCSVMIGRTAKGSTTITASDATPLVSMPQTLTETAGPVTSVTVSLNPSTIIADGKSTSTAKATVTDGQNPIPNENVAFTTSGAPVTFVGPSTCLTGNGGTCTVTIQSTTAAGSTTIAASDGSVSSGPSPSSPTLTQTTGPPATVSMTLNPPIILANAISTTTATAAIADAQGHPLLSEPVSFSSSDPGQFVGGVTNNGDGTYSAQIRGSTTVGYSNITATDGSKTAQATLYQAASPSTTALVASKSSLVTNEGVTLVATVSGGTGSPSGAITFQKAGVAIPGCAGEVISPSSTIATCQTSFAASGSPARITAVFVPGVGSTAPGSTGSLTLPVAQDSTSVLVQMPPSATTGRGVTYTAVVAPPSNRPGPIEPTGTVQFFDNGQPIPSCAGGPLVNSSATCTVTYAHVGTHAITARYGGDANFSASTSPSAQLAVLRAPIIGSLGETMQWNFRFTSSYTKVLLLVVHGASAGDTVAVTCHGHGCPFRKHVSKVTKRKRCSRKHGKPACSARRRTNLTVALQGHRLTVGTKFTVSITRPNWIGKYYAFTMRAGHGPRIRISCLTPGYSKPGVGCSG